MKARGHQAQDCNQVTCVSKQRSKSHILSVHEDKKTVSKKNL